MAQPQDATAGQHAGAQPALLVDLKRQEMEQGWTQGLADRYPAWPRLVEEIIKAQFGDQAVARHIMSNAQQVMHRIRDDATGNLTTVLVDGEVQAGKTINMIALTSYAIACEFKLVVVLAGAQTSLRKQTQKRFQTYFGAPDFQSQDLAGSPVAWLTSMGRAQAQNDEGDIYRTVRGLKLDSINLPADAPDEPLVSGRWQGLRKVLQQWQRLPAGQRPVLLAVIKKNVQSLEAVRTLLSKVEALQHEKHLIIDDEYDAATITDPDMLARRRVTAVGAQTNVEDSVPQAISRIRLLAADTNNAGYAGYTATSFAVMLMNRTKYEALNLRVVPQNCWVLEQHPNTKTYVGLQQIFGRREKHRVLQIVDEKEYVQWEKFAGDAHRLDEAKGQAPANADELVKDSKSIEQLRQAELQNTIERKATESYGGNLKRSWFKFLADYLLTGGIRMFRRNKTPRLLTMQGHNAVLAGIKDPRSCTSTAQDADHQLNQMLQQQGWTMQVTGFVELILQLRGYDELELDHELVTQMMEAERACADQLLKPGSAKRQQLEELLADLQQVINPDVEQAPVQQLNADLMLGVSRPSTCHSVTDGMPSRFLWWILDRICRQAGKHFEVEFLSWARESTEDIDLRNANPGSSSRTASAARPPTMRLARLSTRHLGQQEGLAPQGGTRLLLFPVYSMENSPAQNTVLIPRYYAHDAAVRDAFAQICDNLGMVTDAIDQTQAAEPLYHSGLINPSNLTETQDLVSSCMQQSWVILSTAVSMWLNGDTLQLGNDGGDDQDLEQRWKQQVDHLWTAERQANAGIQPQNFAYARNRGHAYLPKLLPTDGHRKILGRQWARLQNANQGTIGELGLQLSFPESAQHIQHQLRQIIKNTRIAIVNSKNPAEDLEPNNARPYNIYIGGQVLSRGITVEGLTVTLYLNASRTEVADVKLQAGRWFGHRSQYQDLVRVYMTARSWEAFTSFALSARSLRSFLKTAILDNTPLEDCRRQFYREGLLVRHYLQLTGTGRMRDALLLESTKFLSPALDEEHSKSNFVATLQLLQCLQPCKANNKQLAQPDPESGAVMLTPLGALRGRGVAFHNVPVRTVDEYLRNLYDSYGDSSHGELLASSLQESGSVVTDTVNVVLLTNTVVANKHPFIECNAAFGLTAGQAALQEEEQGPGIGRIPQGSVISHDEGNWDAVRAPHFSRWVETGAAAVAAGAASSSNGPTDAHRTRVRQLLARHMQRVQRQPARRSVIPQSLGSAFRRFVNPSAKDPYNDQILDAYGFRDSEGMTFLHGGEESRSWFTAPDSEGARYRTCQAPPLVIITLADPMYAGMYRLAGSDPPAKPTFFSTVHDQQAAPTARAAAYPVPLVVLSLPRFGGLLHVVPGKEDFAFQLPQLSQLPQPAPNQEDVPAPAPEDEPAVPLEDEPVPAVEDPVDDGSCSHHGATVVSSSEAEEEDNANTATSTREGNEGALPEHSEPPAAPTAPAVGQPNPEPAVGERRDNSGSEGAADTEDAGGNVSREWSFDDTISSDTEDPEPQTPRHYWPRLYDHIPLDSFHAADPRGADCFDHDAPPDNSGTNSRKRPRSEVAELASAGPSNRTCRNSTDHEQQIAAALIATAEPLPMQRSVPGMQGPLWQNQGTNQAAVEYARSMLQNETNED